MTLLANAITSPCMDDNTADPPFDLAASANAFRSLFENAGICMARLDSALAVREVNAEFCQALGWTAVEARDVEVLRFLHRSAHSYLRRQFTRLSSGALNRISERVLAVSADESIVPGQLTAMAIERCRTDKPGVLVVFLADRPAAGDANSSHRRWKPSDLDTKILEGVAAGVSSVKIASDLYLSRQGVEYRVSAMLRRLNAPNRAALVSRAYSLGILGVGTWPPQVQPNFMK
ncbi:MAG TPA: LuxR C-terminal-related transcriptional regulator [Umezawaea sp.]|nr:LuxR C-terminal-related transcriptional regulator [Umezawaea sp.]